MAGEFRLRSWLINALRNSFRRYPPFYRVKNTTKEEYFITSKTGKQMRRVRFTCEQCKEKFSNKDIRVDHIEPVVAETGFPTLPGGGDDWNTYIARMFVSDNGLQVLCTGCHDAKTKDENKVRREIKKK